MRTSLLHLSVASALTLLLSACGSQSHEGSKAEKLSPNQLPAAVSQTVNSRLPGAHINKAERENEKGTVIYDLELTQNGRKFEMDVKEDGTLVEIEKQVEPATLPGSSRNQIMSKYTGATIKDVMEVNKVSGGKETVDHYEVTLETADHKSVEFNVSLDGKVGSGEEEKNEKQ